MLVYILNAEETWLYKIGYTKSNSSDARIRAIQTGNSQKILLIWEYITPYAKKIETIIHTHYSHLRKSGEWFLFDNISLEEVKEKILTFEKTIKLLEHDEKISN